MNQNLRNLKKDIENFNFMSKNVDFFSVNIVFNKEIMWRFRVSILPTIMFFKNNQKLYELITIQSTQIIKKKIEELNKII